MAKRIVVMLADGGRREYECDEPLVSPDPDTGVLTVMDGDRVYGTFEKGKWLEFKILPL